MHVPEYEDIACSLYIFSARKSKTHVSLLPRVVARKEAGGGGGEKSEEQRPKLSNEDFRKMLS